MDTMMTSNETACSTGCHLGRRLGRYKSRYQSRYCGRCVLLASVLAWLLTSCTSSPCPDTGCGNVSSGAESTLEAPETEIATQSSAVKQASTDLENVSQSEQGDQKPGELSMQATPDAAQAESVVTIGLDDKSVNARVISTGCTLPEHFKVEHEVRDNACHITLVRTRADYCRRAPFVIDVAVAWEAPAECAGLAVEFVNPVIDMDKSGIKRTTARQLPRQ